MKFLLKLLYVIAIPLLFMHCENDNTHVEFENQNYFYSNTEGNNTIEGSHIYIDSKHEDTLFFNESNSKLLTKISRSWVIGQGSGKPYYDTGKEYYWPILKVLPQLNAIITRPVNQYFSLQKPVVFWKLGPYPVKFSDSLKGSWGFSKIILDYKDSLFKTHLFECDTDVVNLYVATSKNLNTWEVKHLLEPNDFKNIPWNVPDKNHKMKVTPLISDVVYYNEKYYSFAYGDDAEEKTYISVLTSDSLEGKYKIHPLPLISPNPKSKFSNHDVYFPKIIRNDSLWLMYYTSKNEQNEEFLCVAKSDNLMDWKVVKENVLTRNQGWNAGMKNLLCAQVKIVNRQIHLWATGTKDVGNYKKPNKGNALDVCIGKFHAPLNPYSFTEDVGNPIFGGNPTFDFENDHIGGAFQEIDYENYTYTFYHGKGRSGKEYTILVK